MRPRWKRSRRNARRPSARGPHAHPDGIQEQHRLEADARGALCVTHAIHGDVWQCSRNATSVCLCVGAAMRRDNAEAPPPGSLATVSAAKLGPRATPHGPIPDRSLRSSAPRAARQAPSHRRPPPHTRRTGLVATTQASPVAGYTRRLPRFWTAPPHPAASEAQATSGTTEAHRSAAPPSAGRRCGDMTRTPLCTMRQNEVMADMTRESDR